MISKKQVQHIAKLARLGLTANEVKKFQKELSSILDYVEQLKKADVSGIEPAKGPDFIENVMRKDEVKIQEPEKLLEHVPKIKGRYAAVKPIL